MHSNTTTLILTLSIIIWLSPFIAKMLKIPTAPLEIILGSLFAYAGYLGDNEYFDIIAEMGFLYLMFLAGMEVNPKQITQSSQNTLKKSILFVITLGFFAILFGFILDFNAIIIISLPLISIGLLASLSKVYGKKEPWLNLAVTVGVIGEIASIIALTILDVASSVGFGWKLIMQLAMFTIFISSVYMMYRFLVVVFWWYPEFKNVLMPHIDTSDQDVRMAMAVFFIMISTMLTMHLELALGAFIAGVAISAFFHHKKELEEKMSSLGFGFLVPLFFVHVGVSFDLHALMLPGVVSGALLITAVMILIRVFAAFHLRYIRTRIDALLVAFSLSMPLTLLIAVATIGYTSQQIDLYTYYQLILASLFEVIISMLAIKIIRDCCYNLKNR